MTNATGTMLQAWQVPTLIALNDRMEDVQVGPGPAIDNVASPSSTSGSLPV